MIVCSVISARLAALVAEQRLHHRLRPREVRREWQQLRGSQFTAQSRQSPETPLHHLLRCRRPTKRVRVHFFCVLQSVILHCSVNGRNCFGKLNSLFQMLPGTLMPFQMSTFICCSPCLVKQSSTPKPSSPIINWIKVSPFITHPPLFHLSHAASRHKDRTQKSIVSSFFTEPTSWLTEWLETKQRSF